MTVKRRSALSAAPAIVYVLGGGAFFGFVDVLFGSSVHSQGGIVGRSVRGALFALILLVLVLRRRTGWRIRRKKDEARSNPADR